jgi:hypothetical protein
LLPLSAECLFFFCFFLLLLLFFLFLLLLFFLFLLLLFFLFLLLLFFLFSSSSSSSSSSSYSSSVSSSSTTTTTTTTSSSQMALQSNADLRLLNRLLPVSSVFELFPICCSVMCRFIGFIITINIFSKCLTDLVLPSCYSVFWEEEINPSAF